MRKRSRREKNGASDDEPLTQPFGSYDATSEIDHEDYEEEDIHDGFPIPANDNDDDKKDEIDSIAKQPSFSKDQQVQDGSLSLMLWACDSVVKFFGGTQKLKTVLEEENIKLAVIPGLLNPLHVTESGQLWDYHFRVNGTKTKKKRAQGVTVMYRHEPLLISKGPEAFQSRKYSASGTAVTTLEFSQYYVIGVNAPFVTSPPQLVAGWWKELQSYCKELEEHKPLVVCGLMNALSEDQDFDTKDKKSVIDHPVFRQDRTNHLQEFLKFVKLVDVYHHFHSTNTHLETQVIPTMKRSRTGLNQAVSSQLGTGVFPGLQRTRKETRIRTSYILISESILSSVQSIEIDLQIRGDTMHNPIFLQLGPVSEIK